MEKWVACPLEEFFPQRQCAHGPARVEFVGAVAHADDARFTRGTGAGISRAIGVQQDNSLPCLRQMPCRPRAENSRANNGYVVGFLRAHSLCSRAVPRQYSSCASSQPIEPSRGACSRGCEDRRCYLYEFPPSEFHVRVTDLRSLFEGGFEELGPMREMVEGGGVGVVEMQRGDGDGAVADGGVIGAFLDVPIHLLLV